LAVVAEDSGAAHLDLLGPPGWCSGCWPRDGDVAGGAGLLFSDIPVRDGGVGQDHSGSEDSEPAEALLAVLKNPAYRFERIGLEAGPLSQWLFGALAEAELPVVCVETRHMQAVLKAQINKTDRNDARGIAQMMRVGLFRCM
jgi:transposase